MMNQEIANILYEIGYLLEIEGVAFKPQAYEKAAIVLENLDKSIVDIYKKGGTKALIIIPGIGKGIAKKIEEYLITGKIRHYEDLKKKFPIDINGLIAVEGVGPKIVKTLYQELDIKDVNDLEKMAEEHKIASLFGFGEKTEKNILESIKFLKKTKSKFLLGEILPTANKIENILGKLEEVKNFSIAGSLRRKKEMIGDVDFLRVEPKVSYISPVPGGVGPMTIAMLLKNTLKAAKNAAGIK